MLVRDATPDDAGPIAALNVAAWRVAFRGIVSDETLASLSGPPDGRREVLENLAEHVIQLVADEENTVVGWLAAQPCEDNDCELSTDFEVRACYVAPSHWRRGVGRLLMEALVERLTSGQWSRVKLWAARDTPVARAFYRSFGFEEDGAGKVHRLDDGSSVPVVRFSLDL